MTYIMPFFLSAFGAIAICLSFGVGLIGENVSYSIVQMGLFGFVLVGMGGAIKKLTQIHKELQKLNSKR